MDLRTVPEKLISKYACTTPPPFKAVCISVLITEAGAGLPIRGSPHNMPARRGLHASHAPAPNTHAHREAHDLTVSSSTWFPPKKGPSHVPIAAPHPGSRRRRPCARSVCAASALRQSLR